MPLQGMSQYGRDGAHAALTGTRAEVGRTGVVL